MKQQKLYFIGIVILSFLVGGGSGYFLLQYLEQDTNTSIRGNQGYTFINPLIECEVNTIGKKQKYIPFENETINRIREEIQDKNPKIHLSVYFRNLNNGPWFGINEDEDFSPASLMKLPILMMYMKWSESDPQVFKKVIQVEKNPNQVPQLIQPDQSIITGQSYSIESLLTYLIVYSDNTALSPLLSYIPDTLYNRVFTDLGVPLPKEGEYTLSVKEYASFYRILYNAAFLSNEGSEKTLQLLAQTRFDNGIRGNIPKNIVIAHKFGEREITTEGGIQHQLHDCGIIYHPGYPYLVCIMTKGDADMTTLSDVIKNTSDIIYTEVSSRF